MRIIIWHAMAIHLHSADLVDLVLQPGCLECHEIAGVDDQLLPGLNHDLLDSAKAREPDAAHVLPLRGRCQQEHPLAAEDPLPALHIITTQLLDHSQHRRSSMPNKTAATLFTPPPSSPPQQ